VARSPLRRPTSSKHSTRASTKVNATALCDGPAPTFAVGGARVARRRARVAAAARLCLPFLAPRWRPFHRAGSHAADRRATMRRTIPSPIAGQPVVGRGPSSKADGSLLGFLTKSRWQHRSPSPLTSGLVGRCATREDPDTWAGDCAAFGQVPTAQQARVLVCAHLRSSGEVPDWPPLVECCSRLPLPDRPARPFARPSRVLGLLRGMACQWKSYQGKTETRAICMVS